MMSLSPAPRPMPPAYAELDEVTLERARRGDRDGCRALVQRYERPVFALVGRMVVPERDCVEDLAQETFLRVFKALPRFDRDGAAKLSSWILTIATRVTIDHLRKRKDALLVDASVVPLEAPTRTDDGARRRELGRALRESAAELAPPFRAAFLLREYHHLSYDEIAHALECDAGTVKSRLNRARRPLRTALQERGFDA
ncbi:MAG: sigma-70 family RNA polymerase sigma factor [Proteobacteria bacterium]|nr:sigma-70 family RNA polymerase sigma factor [Pseudomonadota bacterium]